MKFAWYPSVPSHSDELLPAIQHVLYEYDGPKLVLALEAHARQVIGVCADEIFEERILRWVFAPAAPAQVVALLDGHVGLREIFTQGAVRLVDVAPDDTSISWELEGASLPDALLPDADATLPELTAAVLEHLLAEQRRLAEEQERREAASVISALAPSLARTELLFDGRPVVGRQGINAAFAAAAVAKYQELVSLAYGSRRRGTLGPTGPIPHRAESTLYLVDMPRGSVGFALRELAEQGVSAPTGLAEVVSDVGTLIDAAASGDQELADAVGDFEPRVVSTLRELFSVLHKAEATLRLIVNDRTYRFDSERVKMAAERTATEPSEEPDRALVGTLRGYLPDARQFELQEAREGAVIRGRIAREANLGELRKWLEKRGEAHVRVVTVKRGGRELHAFTLLRIEALKDVQP